MHFTDLGLAEPILKALAAKKYATPTPIQTQAIPVLLQGKDLCGIAQTGTGKTAAFALPSLDHFARNPKTPPLQGCRMLVLSPTRELAAQIAQSFRDYGRFMKLSVEVVFGGVPINKQIRALSRGVDIVVATPGRLLDLIDQRAFTIKDTEIFVLDEADQMMDMGFIHPLKRIAKLLPRERQNLFFSATMPKEIEALAAQFLNDPVKVSVAPQSTTAERIRQHATFVNQAEKQALLTLTVKDEAINRALIFTRTKHGADRVVRFLEGAGIQAFAIHGNKSQGQRTTALQAFRDGRVKLLVATDIAARGIDVSGVSHVINFELPNVPEQYVHRIGRTARAGAEGIAISFVADDERPYQKSIERTTKVKLDIMPLPENFVEVVRNLPKAAPPRKGREQTPEQKTRRADGQRRYQDQQQRGAPERAHRPDGEQPAKKPFRRRRTGVGAHKGAVQRTTGR
ncbi:MAG TPA: DEAD/DEAH box helicase [Sphingobium sp.]